MFVILRSSVVGNVKEEESQCIDVNSRLVDTVNHGWSLKVMKALHMTIASENIPQMNKSRNMKMDGVLCHTSWYRCIL